jgi:hypothetical protein
MKKLFVVEKKCLLCAGSLPGQSPSKIFYWICSSFCFDHDFASNFIYQKSAKNSRMSLGQIWQLRTGKIHISSRKTYPFRGLISVKWWKNAKIWSTDSILPQAQNKRNQRHWFSVDFLRREKGKWESGVFSTITQRSLLLWCSVAVVANK